MFIPYFTDSRSPSHIHPYWTYIYTYPRKINMEPENDGLEDDFPFQLGDF